MPSKKDEEILSPPVLKDLREIESEATRIVRQRFGVKSQDVKEVIIASSNLVEIAGMPIFKLEGYMDIIVKEAGFLSSEETDRVEFIMKFQAQTGQLVGFERVE
jgi:hypothetical protein